MVSLVDSRSYLMQAPERLVVEVWTRQQEKESWELWRTSHLMRWQELF